MVAIDGFHLGPRSRAHGIRRYLTSLVAGLAAADVDVRVLASARSKIEAPVVVTPQLPIVRLAMWQRHLMLSRHLSRLDPDLAHVPGLPPPRNHRSPWVMTIHDLFPLENPSDHPVDARWWRVMGGQARNATRVIAISAWTAGRVRAVLDVPASRIEVVHPGLSPDFHPDGPADRGDERPYVVFVGAADPRKRIEVAVAAMDQVVTAGLPHRLVVVGDAAGLPGSWRQHPRVELRGWVDDLASVYRGASACVVTSKGEGFGYAAVEAMACGTPVVAIANSATEEIAGPAALLTADNPDACGGGLVEVLSDETTADDLRTRGRHHAALFSRATTTRRLLDVYASILRP